MNWTEWWFDVKSSEHEYWIDSEGVWLVELKRWWTELSCDWLLQTENTVQYNIERKEEDGDDGDIDLIFILLFI